MSVSDNRPFFLNLLKIHLPVTGFVSILHRISGMLMFLAIPFTVYLLDLSLQDDQGFAQASGILQQPIVQLLTLVLLWSLIHHLLAGIRFLLIDFEIGLEKQQAILFSWAVFIIQAILLLLLIVGVYL